MNTDNELKEPTVEEVEVITSRACDAAINAGLGVSEWRAFLTAKEASALALAEKRVSD